MMRPFVREVVWPLPPRKPKPFVVGAVLTCIALVAAKVFLDPFVIRCHKPSRHDLANQGSAHRRVGSDSIMGPSR